jgi:hypothetical protein
MMSLALRNAVAGPPSDRRPSNGLHNKPMEPTSLALAVRHVLLASWARRRAMAAVLRSGRGSSASRYAAEPKM